MTVRRAAFGALAVLALGLSTACASAQDHVLSFEPGENQAQVQGLRIDVVEARYAERQLTVECAVANTTDAPINIDRDGVLLDDEGLEIPPVALTGQPREFTIPAGGSTLVQFAFAVGGLEPRTRTLGLWTIRSQSTPLPPLRVKIPGVRTLST